MVELPETLLNVIDQLSKIPGVGDKTATRQTLILAKWSSQDLNAFGDAMKNLAHLKSCVDCGMYSDNDLCEICADAGRKEGRSICVVENVTDCLAIERSGNYDGLYHILGGVLNPLMGIGPEELKIDNFVKRAKSLEVESVILAVNPSVEGDATCSYIKQVLPENIEVDRIGFGIPMGGSLEYLDTMTIAKALENKKKM
ncbi:recombination mediator RecR [Halobacteriovorax sp. JY17]|uniref:recombination mediator RecR n=1 Tax=Halobacteriovorax sp. JY17 TaxID=2014617 RepID=UPI000C56788A|nr:recombination mediator RecR [Halobacteriovorax sp. JY17]PIK14406.1 MAG: recombination protein RecR [Halobacteriovorax sp. JY17]